MSTQIYRPPQSTFHPCIQTFCQRTLREVKMLTRFEHENIIDLKDVICENTVDKLKVRIMLVTSIPIWGYNFMT